jgi:hypothetical protein
MCLRSSCYGVFTEDRSSFASMDHRDAGGNRTGTTSASTGSPDQGGRWHTVGNRLYLTWPDGSHAEYHYDVGGSPGDRGMNLTPPGGKAQYWKQFA